MRVRATTIVRLVVEVTPSDCWGDGTKLEQVRSQGVEAALGILRRALKDSGTDRVRIVETQACDMLVREEKE